VYETRQRAAAQLFEADAALMDAARCLPYGERLPPRISCGLQRRSAAADGQR